MQKPVTYLREDVTCFSNGCEAARAQLSSCPLTNVCGRLFATLWTVAYHSPPSMGFSRQEYWSGLPFPSPEDLPDPGIEPGLLHCRQTLYHLSHQGSPMEYYEAIKKMRQTHI